MNSWAAGDYYESNEMGTELETTMHEHTLKQFWGGDERGVCVQITSTSGVDDEGFVCLTMEEAAALCGDLISFVKAEAIRRQRLLKKQIEQMRLCERTVFNEIAELPADLISADELVVTMVSRFCPKTPNVEVTGPCLHGSGGQQGSASPSCED